MERDREAEEIAVELMRLRHRYTDLERQFARLHERVLAFPSDFGRAQEEAMSSQLISLTSAMRLLEANLRTVHPPRLRFMPALSQ